MREHKRDNSKFLKNWEQTLKGGIIRHILKCCAFTIVVFFIMGSFFIITKRRFLGLEGWPILLPILEKGFFVGLGISIGQWFFNNNKYNDLKEKERKESEYAN